MRWTLVTMGSALWAHTITYKRTVVSEGPVSSQHYENKIAYNGTSFSSLSITNTLQILEARLVVRYFSITKPSRRTLYCPAWLFLLRHYMRLRTQESKPYGVSAFAALSFVETRTDRTYSTIQSTLEWGCREHIDSPLAIRLSNKSKITLAAEE